jgi:predicted DNA binding CopG/RHH family protein
MADRKIELNPPFHDDEERKLIESIDLDVPRDIDLETRKLEMKEFARNTMNPPKVQISTRLAKRDLSRLKAIAVEKGIPYQTLLGSVVHQYVEGRLKEV